MAILRRPIEVYPHKETVSPTDTSVDFTVKIDGTVCQKYSLRIYELSTGTLKKTYSATLTSPNYVYDGQTLTVAVDMTDASLGANDYYWQIDLYWDSTDSDAYVTSYDTVFYASAAPSISFSPSDPTTVTVQYYEALGSYSQAQDKIVKWFEIKLYDSGGTEIDTSDVQYLEYIQHTFYGLRNGYTYGIEILGVTEDDVEFSTGIVSFTVSYSVPTTSAPSPTATLGNDSSVYVDWGAVVYIVGTDSGTTSYVSDFNIAGNYGLSLGSGAYVYFAVDILTSTFTAHAVFKPASGFTGDMLEIYDTGASHYAKVGYDGSRFYLNVDGSYDYDIPEALTTNNYIIAIKSDGSTMSQYHREVI